MELKDTTEVDVGFRGRKRRLGSNKIRRDHALLDEENEESQTLKRQKSNGTEKDSELGDVSGGIRNCEDVELLELRKNLEMNKEMRRIRELKRHSALTFDAHNSSQILTDPYDSSRASGLLSKGNKDLKPTGQFEAELREHFKVERDNNQILDEQMESYIEAHIQSKNHQKHNGHKSIPKSSSIQNDEDALYTIPEHLKIPKIKSYDPGAALPTAGVEEVNLPMNFCASQTKSNLRRPIKTESINR